MGVLRTLLSLLVVCAHLAAFDKQSTINWLTGGAVTAVNAFFLISGFYISLILRETYVGRPIAFYAARSLRLLPLYWGIVVITLLLGASVSTLGNPLRVWENLFSREGVTPTSMWLLFSNITFIGLDFSTILCSNMKSFILCFSDSPKDFARLKSYTIVPQAWSLGTEITFYIIAPFIIKHGLRGAISFFLLALSLHVAFRFGGDSEQNIKLFPYTAIFFALGVLSQFSYQFHSRFKLVIPYTVVTVMTIVCCLSYTYLFAFNWTNPRWWIIEAAFFAWLFVFVPILFRSSEKNRFDSIIGDLSYPIYITHIFALAVSTQIGMSWTFFTGGLGFVFHIGVVLFVAVISLLIIVHPVERIRRKVKQMGLPVHPKTQVVAEIRP